MIIIYRKFHLKICEIWFDEEVNFKEIKENTDVIKYYQKSSPIPGAINEEFFTIVIDLDQPEDTIFKKFNYTTRYEIKYSTKNYGFNYTYFDTFNRKILDEFYRFYDIFAKRMNLSSIDKNKIEALMKENKLVITGLEYKGKIVVYHVYLKDKSCSRVRLLHSCRLIADDKETLKMISMANRFLHYKDIVTFKRMNIKIYDFGGWYSGIEDKKKLNINKFKEGFGGVIVKMYNAELPISYRYKLLSSFYKTFKSMKRWWS